jgi:N-ethylmaleimide reductase
VRLSSLKTQNDIRDDDPEATFGYIAEKLSEFGLAYLHLVNPALKALEQGAEPDRRALRMVDLMREKYRGTLMIAGGFDQDTAEAWLREGKADLIAFGRKFIANGLAGAVPAKRAAQRRRSFHVLRRRHQGIHRLPGARPGTGRAA